MLSEHNCLIYCDSFDIGDVSGDGVAPGGTGPSAMVGTGGVDWEGEREAARVLEAELT